MNIFCLRKEQKSDRSNDLHCSALVNDQPERLDVLVVVILPLRLIGHDPRVMVNGSEQIVRVDPDQVLQPLVQLEIQDLVLKVGDLRRAEIVEVVVYCVPSEMICASSVWI